MNYARLIDSKRVFHEDENTTIWTPVIVRKK